VDGATAVVRSTLLSTADEPAEVSTGALVSDSVLQWGSRATSMAVVERSVLAERGRAERRGQGRDSVIGPGTEVAAGEVISCVLGPLVGCHHQSLLISTLWPAGRGNVAYGANAGSNHTSRAPDQEFRAGEGLFLGLGVNVKFPCDFSRAPYTVVACAVDLPPQRVTFPFSLIAPPAGDAPGAPAGFNRIVPAWALREAVDAYHFYALYYALLGLRQQLRDAAAGRGEVGGLLATQGAQEEWEYQRRLLVEEFGIEDAGAGLTLLASMALQVAKDCEQARGKDDARGVRVIGDYADVHPPADRDRVVRQAYEEADQFRDEVVNGVLAGLLVPGNGTGQGETPVGTARRQVADEVIAPCGRSDRVPQADPTMVASA